MEELVLYFSLKYEGDFQSIYNALMRKEHVDEKTIRVLSRRLNEDEKAALLAEGAEATDWIYTVIKEICKGEREND